MSASAGAAGSAWTLPERIYAIASPKSVGGVSMFDAQSQIGAHNVASFFSDEEITNRVVRRLQDHGFDVLQVTLTTINIAGSPEMFAQAFGADLFIDQRKVIKPGAEEALAEFIDSRGTDISGLVSTAGTAFDDLLEGVAIEEPRYYMTPLPFPPVGNTGTSMFRPGCHWATTPTARTASASPARA